MVEDSTPSVWVLVEDSTPSVWVLVEDSVFFMSVIGRLVAFIMG